MNSTPFLTRIVRGSIAIAVDSLCIAAALLRALDTTIAPRPIPLDDAKRAEPPPAPAPPFWLDNPEEAAIVTRIDEVLVGLGWLRDAIQWELDDRNGRVTVLVEVPLQRSGAIKTMGRRVHQSMSRLDTPEALASARLELLQLILLDVQKIQSEPEPAVILPAPEATPIVAPAWTEKQAKIVEEVFAAALKSGWSEPTSDWTWTVSDLGNGNHNVGLAGGAAGASVNGSSLVGALRNLRDFLEAPPGVA